jgi:hypothetical protein
MVQPAQSRHVINRNKAAQCSPPLPWIPSIEKRIPPNHPLKGSQIPKDHTLHQLNGGCAVLNSGKVSSRTPRPHQRLTLLHLYSPPQALARFPIAVPIQIGVPLAEEFLGALVGANLPAAVMATTWEEELRSGSTVLGCCGPIAAAAMAEIPGPLNAPWNRPGALAKPVGDRWAAATSAGTPANPQPSSLPRASAPPPGSAPSAA